MVQMGSRSRSLAPVPQTRRHSTRYGGGVLLVAPLLGYSFSLRVSATASRRGRSRGPRGEQPVHSGVLPARRLTPVAARTRQHGARVVAEPQWARKRVSRRVDDAVCAAGGATEAAMRAK